MIFITSDYINGFIHPFHGLDHILVMLSIGVLAFRLRDMYMWLLPVTFVAIMEIGSLVSHFAFKIPDTESMILLSCFIVSVISLKKENFSIPFILFIISYFAFFHGYAHAVEFSSKDGFFSYNIGFIVATLLLHTIGIMCAQVIDRSKFLTNFSNFFENMVRYYSIFAFF